MLGKLLESDFSESGGSTALPFNVSHRLGRLAASGLLRGRWLDCGCSDGGYTTAMLDRGVQRAVGIELQFNLLRPGRRISRTGVSYACGVAETLPFADNTFDGVLLNEVLEHVADETRSLNEIYRVVRPEGYLALISPNRWFPFEGHGMQVLGRGVPMPIPLLPWLPRRIGSRFMVARNYWPRELEDLVKTAGFEVCHSSSVFPVFELYSLHPWLSQGVIARYRKAMPGLERLPVIGKFGVSTLVVGRKPVG